MKLERFHYDEGDEITTLILDRFAVYFYRDAEGRFTVDVSSAEVIHKHDVHEGNAVPKIRFILNEEDRVTNPDGEWVDTP